MNKHDEARQQLQFLNRTVLITEETILNNENLSKYITDMEAMEKHFIESEKKMRDDYFELLKKHNELKHDVKRYFELDDKNRYWKVILTADEELERVTLNVKLSKVGDEK